MHELSIAMSIVDAALAESEPRGVQVRAVHLRLGALSGVVKDALLFSCEIACQDTALAGSQLIVEDLPAIVFCSAGAVEFDWETARKSIQSVRPGIQIFRLSAKTGEGMEEYLNFLSQQLSEQRAVAHT